MRHLTEQQALAALRRRALIEQAIALRDGVLTWLSAGSSGEQFVLRRFRCLEPAAEDVHEVYGFESADEGDPYGSGVVIGTFDDPAQLLDAASILGASVVRWVNEAVIDAEYADLRAARET